MEIFGVIYTFHFVCKFTRPNNKIWEWIFIMYTSVIELDFFEHIKL